MSKHQRCKKCDQPARSGGLCDEHREEERIAQQAEYDEGPWGQFEQVADLDEMKAWIREHVRL